MAKNMTNKWARVIQAYLSNGCNQEKSMLAAGYAAKTARNFPGCVFKNERFLAQLKVAQDKLAKKHELNADWVIKRYMKLADAGDTLAKFKKVQDDGSLAWDFTDATEEELALIMELSTDTFQDGRGDAAREVKKFRVRIPDPEKALNALARHLGLFNDKLEVSGDVTELLNRGRMRAHRDVVETDPDSIH